MRYLATLLLLIGVGCAGSLSSPGQVDPSKIHQGSPRFVVDAPESINPAVSQTFRWMLLGHPSRFQKQYLWVFTVYGRQQTLYQQPYRQRFFTITTRGLRPYELAELRPRHMTPATLGLYEVKGYNVMGGIVYDRSKPVVFWGEIIPFVWSVARTSPSTHETPASHCSQSCLAQ